MELLLKQRIVGALIILSVAIIVIPSLLDGPIIDSEYLVLDVPPHPEIKTYKTDNTEYEAMVSKVDEQISQDQVPADLDHLDKNDEVARKPTVEPARPELKPAWTVQLGSFTQIENAKELKHTLQKNQFRAYMKKAQTENGINYRVFVGPEIRQSDANSVAQKLQKEFGLSGLVVRYSTNIQR